MGQLRRIVPDTSVMLPAFFREEMTYGDTAFDLTRRAEPLADAIRTGGVKAVAPDLLQYEFLKRAFAKMSPRGKSPTLDADIVENQVLGFMRLDLVYQPMLKLAPIAWDLMRNGRIPPPDSWFLACAIHWEAELWISHEHQDGFARKAREIHRDVHILTDKPFT